jgi:histidine ammonia-lyase
MVVQLSSRADMTLDAFRQVAWEGKPVALSDAAYARIEAARGAFLRLIARDPGAFIYGVTSGFGSNARRPLQEHEKEAFYGRTMAVGRVSFGEPLPERVVRGILFTRLSNLIEGHAATTPRVVRAVVEMLNGERPVPAVPRGGNGSAGEILPLYHLFGPLSEAFVLAPKEKGPLVNGAPCAAALLADAALAARRRLSLADEIFALSALAFQAPLTAYDPVLGELWNDPGAAAALDRFAVLLAGAGPSGRPHQAPVSFRILPRVLGRCHRAVVAAEEGAAALIPAVTDNPVYLPPDAEHPDGRCFSTGGYHDSRSVPAMDELAANWADLCLMSERHATKTLDGGISTLPHQLLRDPEAAPGGAGYVAYLPMAIVGFLEAARSAASRTLLPGSEGGSFGQDDVASPVFAAWDKQERAGLALERTLALLAVIASQALWVTERAVTPGLAARLRQIRETVAPVDERSPRALGPECAVLAEGIRAEIYATAQPVPADARRQRPAAS